MASRFGDSRAWPHSSGNLADSRNWEFQHNQFAKSLSTDMNGVSGPQGEHPHAKFWPFFGKNPHPMYKPADFAYDREVLNLPEAFQGNNTFISQLLITKISRQEQVWITEVLPWTKWEGGLTINWDRWIFNDNLLTRTPEQSVSRMLTSERDAKTETITRFGIAFMAEHGFMLTPQGRTAYAANLQQIVNATVETLCLGVMEALLFVEYDRWRDATVTSLNNRKQLEDRFNIEIRDFARIQKEPAGFVMLAKDMSQTFQKRTGRPPNMYVVGPAALAALELMKLDPNAYYVGVQSTIDSIAKRARANGATIHAMRSVRAGDKGQDINPAEVRTVIGGFTVLSVNEVRNASPETMRTELLNRDIHVDPADAYYTLQYKKLLPLTGLFVRADGAPLGGGGGGFGAAYAKGDANNYNLAPAGGKGPTWTLSEQGRQFFTGYRYVGEYMKARGVMTPWIRSFLSKHDLVKQSFIDECVGAEGKQARNLTEATRRAANQQAGLFDAKWFATFLEDLKSEAANQPASEEDWGLGEEEEKPAAGLGLGSGEAKRPPEGLDAVINRIAKKLNAVGSVAGSGALLVLSKLQGLMTNAANAAKALQAEEGALTGGALTFPGASAALQRVLHAGNPARYATDKKHVGVLVFSKSDTESLSVYVEESRAPSAAANEAIWNLFEGRLDKRPGGDFKLDTPELTVHKEVGFEGVFRAFTDPKTPEVYDYKGAVDNVRTAEIRAAMRFVSTRAADVKGRLGHIEKQRRKDGSPAVRVPQNVQSQIGDLYYIAQDELDAIYSRCVRGGAADKSFNGDAEFVEMMKGVGAAYRELMGGNSAQSKQEAETGLSMLLNEFYEGSLLNDKKQPRDIVAEARDKKATHSYAAIFGRTMQQLALLNYTMGEVGMRMFHTKLQPGIYRTWLRSQGSEGGGKSNETLLEAYRRLGKEPANDALSGEAAISEPGIGDYGSVERLLNSISMDNADIFRWSMEKDCWPILQLISWAPAKTFMTSPTIALRGFGEAGLTLHGHHKFELGDDPARQVHYGHFTLYAKAIITDEKLVEHRYHSHVASYVSGNDGSHWDPADPADHRKYEAKSAEKSRFVTAAHADEDLSSDNYLFLTGKPPPELGGDGTCKPEGHEAFSRFWGWEHSMSLLQQSPYRQQGLGYNTMCFREHSLGTVMKGTGEWDPVGHVHLERGHFGVTFGYPGSSRIYTGGTPWLMNPNFSPTSMRALVNHA